MKAGLVTGQRRFELVDMPQPTARPGQAVVQVHLCGICGTDVHGFLSSQPYNPAICGHEFVGTVSQVGAGVDHLHEGDRVVAGIAPACGRCPNCLAGRPRYCSTAFLGMVGRDPQAPPHGAFASAIALDAGRFVKVTRPLTDEEAAVVEPTVVVEPSVVEPATVEPPQRPTLNVDSQGKHVPGHNNYTPGRSVLTHPDPDALLRQFAGKGTPLNKVPRFQPGFRERVSFGTVIGDYVDPATGIATPTTNGVIHYGGRGAHIVPARP